MQLVISNNTKENFLWEPEKMNVKFHKITSYTPNFGCCVIEELYLCFHNSCEIWHSFFPTPMRNFLWGYYRWLITSLALEICKKECNVHYLMLLQGFCPLTIKITQFRGGFRLNLPQFCPPVPFFCICSVLLSVY